MDQPFEVDDWATTTARSLALAGSISTLLLAGACLALLLGVVGAVATFSTLNRSVDLGDFASMNSSSTSMTITQVSSILLSCLLPAGVLAAAGVALRVQVARFGAENLGS